MKKTWLFTGLAVIMISLSGCLSTLYPLFTEKDLVFEPGLLGSWSEKGDSEQMIFEKASSADLKSLPALQTLAGKAYMLTMKEDNEELRFYAFLTRLGKNTYLDLYPAETPRQQQYDAFYKSHYVSMHSLYRLQMKGNSFEIGQLKEDYLKDLIRKNQVRIKHEVNVDGFYVITAPTEELQQYVLKYGQVPEAYEEPATYHKLVR